VEKEENSLKVTEEKQEEEILSNLIRKPRTRNSVKAKDDVIKPQVSEEEEILDAEHDLEGNYH
jgi:hypothetical protein